MGNPLDNGRVIEVFDTLPAWRKWTSRICSSGCSGSIAWALFSALTACRSFSKPWINEKYCAKEMNAFFPDFAGLLHRKLSPRRWYYLLRECWADWVTWQLAPVDQQHSGVSAPRGRRLSTRRPQAPYPRLQMVLELWYHNQKQIYDAYHLVITFLGIFLYLLCGLLRLFFSLFLSICEGT